MKQSICLILTRFWQAGEGHSFDVSMLKLMALKSQRIYNPRVSKLEEIINKKTRSVICTVLMDLRIMKFMPQKSPKRGKKFTIDTSYVINSPQVQSR